MYVAFSVVEVVSLLLGGSGVTPGELLRFPRGVPPVVWDLYVLSTLMLSSRVVVACMPGNGIPSLLRCGANVHSIVFVILPWPPSRNGSGNWNVTLFFKGVSFAVFLLSIISCYVGGVWVPRLSLVVADPFPEPILILI